MDAKKLKLWLRTNGHNRAWLAEQCSVSKRTVDGWFASDKKMPGMAATLIGRLMDDENQKFKLDFDQWTLIDSAMKKTGYESFGEFCSDSVKSYAEELVVDI